MANMVSLKRARPLVVTSVEVVSDKSQILQFNGKEYGVGISIRKFCKINVTFTGHFSLQRAIVTSEPEQAVIDTRWPLNTLHRNRPVADTHCHTPCTRSRQGKSIYQNETKVYSDTIPNSNPTSTWIPRKKQRNTFKNILHWLHHALSYFLMVPHAMLSASF